MGVGNQRTTSTGKKAATSAHAVEQLTGVADALHALLVKRAEDLAGCVEGSPEETELASIADALQAYEGKRWPLGKSPGSKG